MIVKTTWGVAPALGISALLATSLGFQLVTAAQQAAPASASGDAKSAEFFETRVRPVLAASCFDCHTDQRNGGLRVDSREALLKGGRSGPAIVPGDPDKSRLIQAMQLSRLADRAIKSWGSGNEEAHLESLIWKMVKL